jgi:hypothetical protein
MTTQKKQRLRTISKRRRQFIATGYRSGLEETIGKQIKDAGLPVNYETDTIAYIWPERTSTYTPDFRLAKQDGTPLFIETKGRWDVSDRQKHLLIREQHPEIDIRFVFSNQNAKLYKGSPTTYAQWCEKHGFLYAHKTIPEEWLTE